MRKEADMDGEIVGGVATGERATKERVGIGHECFLGVGAA